MALHLQTLCDTVYGDLIKIRKKVQQKIEQVGTAWDIVNIVNFWKNNPYTVIMSRHKPTCSEFHKH